MSAVVIFFFKDTATTEIYPYLLTRSRRDALPIFFTARRCSTAAPNYSAKTRASWLIVRLSRWIRKASADFHESTPCRSRRWLWHNSAADNPNGMRSMRLYRSEEHTSELQSLMRISYAVFCLKKTTHINNNTTNRYNRIK